MVVNASMKWVGLVKVVMCALIMLLIAVLNCRELDLVNAVGFI